MNKDVPREMLYHYCGVNAFKEIIESKCLWLSHIRYMNDYMEHRWLLERAENHWPSLDKFDVELLAHVRKPAEFADLPYVCCFSTEGDLLSQWRAYSDDGAGTAIGFSKVGIDTLTNNVLATDTRMSLAEVVYDLDKQDRTIREVVDRVAATFREFGSEQGNDDLRTTVFQLEGIAAQHQLWVAAASCKNPRFAEEKEWRIIAHVRLEASKGGDAVRPNDVMGNVRFRVTGRHQLVPYYPLPFNPGVLSTVTLGPKNTAREDHETIKLFLAANGYPSDDIRIVNSEATYR